jgi:hypothetical protein
VSRRAAAAAQGAPGRAGGGQRAALLAALSAAAVAGIAGVVGAPGVRADEIIGSSVVSAAFELKIARFGHFVFTPEGGALATVGEESSSFLVAYDGDGKELWRFGPGKFPYPPAPVAGGGASVTFFSPERVWAAVRIGPAGKKTADFGGLEPMSASTLAPDGTTYVVRAGDLLALTPDMATRWSVRVGERADLRDPPHVTPSGTVVAPGDKYAFGVEPTGKVLFKRALKKGRVTMRSHSSVGTVIWSRDPGPEALAASLVELINPAGKKVAAAKLKFVTDVEVVPEAGMLVVGAAKADADPTAVLYAAAPAAGVKAGGVLWASAKTVGPGKVYDAGVGRGSGAVVFLSVESGKAGAPEVLAVDGAGGGVRWRTAAPRPYVFVSDGSGEGPVFAAPVGGFRTLSRIDADAVSAPSVVLDDLNPTEAIPGPGGRVALRDGVTVRVYRP